MDDKEQLALEHFGGFVSAFVEPHRQDRWRHFSSSASRLRKIYDRFSDMRDIDCSKILIGGGTHELSEFLNALDSHQHDDGEAMLFSEYKSVDWMMGDPRELIQLVFKTGIPSMVSIKLGRMVFIETQELKGQYLLGLSRLGAVGKNDVKKAGAKRVRRH